MKIRLKCVREEQDFRQNEWTLLEKLREWKSYPGDLKTGEAFLFVSQTGNQLVFITGVHEVEVNGKTRTILDSRRWRIRGTTWSPIMLAEYAASVGLELLNQRSFSQAYERYREAKRAKMEGEQGE